MVSSRFNYGCKKQMKSIGFLLTGIKGWEVLKRFGHKVNLSFVQSYNDAGTLDQSLFDIENYCNSNKIQFYNTDQHLPDVYKKADRIFVIGWQKIIPPPYDKFIVLHDSGLPKKIGWSPLVTALINGETTLETTAFKMSEEVDMGDRVSYSKRDIEYPMKIKDAMLIVSDMYEEMLNDILMKEEPQGTEMNLKGISYSLWRDEEDYKIDWNQDADSIKRHIDASGFPYAGAKAIWEGQQIRILDAEVYGYNKIELPAKSIGKIMKFTLDGDPVVVCGKGQLILKNIQMMGTKIYIRKLKTRLS